MDKFHKVTQLDSPARLALFRIREDGDDSSVQGNSKGEVNSPKVLSVARYACSSCQKDYPKKAEVLKHIADDHSPENAVTSYQDNDMSGDEEGLEEACELYEALEALTQELKEPDNADENGELLKKIERFKVLVKKKTNIQKASNHEVKMLKEVQENQEAAIKEKEEETAEANNKVKKLEKDMRTAAAEKEKFNKDLGAVQKRSGELVKENNNLKTMLKEKESIIVSLEEQMNDVHDEGTDNSVIEEDVLMRNNQSENKCTACNKRFSNNNDLERHIGDKHNEVECPFCRKTFSNRSKLQNHVNNCLDNGTVKVNCNKCNQTFTRFGLNRHMKQCQKKKELKCKECGMLTDSGAEMKSHMNKDHSQSMDKSKEICYHYRNGFCFRGDSCRYSHVGHQRGSTSGSTSRPGTDRHWTPACTKGESCSWLARGACKFFHRGVGVQRPHKPQHNTNQASGNNENRRSVNFNSRSGFPPLQRGNQNMRRNTGRH